MHSCVLWLLISAAAAVWTGAVCTDHDACTIDAVVGGQCVHVPLAAPSLPGVHCDPTSGETVVDNVPATCAETVCLGPCGAIPHRGFLPYGTPCGPNRTDGCSAGYCDGHGRCSTATDLVADASASDVHVVAAMLILVTPISGLIITTVLELYCRGKRWEWEEELKT